MIRLRPLSPLWKCACCCWGWSLARFARDHDAVLVVVHSDYLPVVHMRVTTRQALAELSYEEIAPDTPKLHGWRGLWHAATARWSVWRSEITDPQARDNEPGDRPTPSAKERPR